MVPVLGKIAAADVVAGLHELGVTVGEQDRFSVRAMRIGLVRIIVDRAQAPEVGLPDQPHYPRVGLGSLFAE